ncbi:MAG: response regulator transcription factor [Candidatus Pacebacteria bacterium]|nr:response regulator transcription factor [Candidatus Paceibacterota bacterium]
MKILFVDDDADLREVMRDNLEAESYTVDVAPDGKKGSFMARTNHYDLVILDYSMPEKNGEVVIKEIRGAGLATPIMFLSVIDDLDKKIAVFKSGADDYVQKPFTFAELSARVRAILRRPPEIKQDIITLGGITLDLSRNTAKLDGSPLHLTRKEFNLLRYLVSNAGLVLSRSMIMENVWNADSDPFSNTIEAHITNLRKKLHLNNRQYIRNVPGRGYMIDNDHQK